MTNLPVIAAKYVWMPVLTVPVLTMLAACAVQPPHPAPPPELTQKPLPQPDELVRAVQQALFRLHYLTQRDVTGWNGPRTRRAIIAAERTNGMRDDGKVTRRLLHRLRAPEAIAAQEIKPPDPQAQRTVLANAAAEKVAEWVEPLPVLSATPAALSPPAVLLSDPVVHNTATLSSNQTQFTLTGVRGLVGEYAAQLQSYIDQHGRQVACAPEGESGGFICSVNNTINLAAVALVNGAAVITIDASEGYVRQQADAVSHHRGVWAGQGEDPLQPVPEQPAPEQPAAQQPVDPCNVTPCRAAQNTLPVNH